MAVVDMRLGPGCGTRFVASILMTAVACSLPVRLPDGGPVPSEHLRRPLASYRGDACDAALHPIPQEGEGPASRELNEDRSLGVQLLLAVCERRQRTPEDDGWLTRAPRIAELPLKETYLHFDDRRSSRLRLAIAVVQAAARLGETSLLREAKKDLGLVRFLASVIRPADLAAELAQLAVPAQAKQAFLGAYAAISARLPDTLLMKEEARLFIDIPRTVWQQRRDHFVALASYYSQLDVLSAQAQAARWDPGLVDPTVKALQDLRARFVLACGGLDCTTQPLFGQATVELAQLHVLHRDVLGARGESVVHLADGSWRSGLAQAVFVAQLAYGTFLGEANARYRRAREQGSDGVTALAVAGGTSGLPFDSDMLLQADLVRPNYAAALSADPDQHSDQHSNQHSNQHSDQHSAAAQAVSCAADRCQVTFQADRVEAMDEYDCYKTGRIVRILLDGTLQYEEACKARPITLETRRPPVFFPKREVASIQPGEVLSFVTEGSEGRIFKVWRNRQLVQVRDARGPR